MFLKRASSLTRLLPHRQDSFRKTKGTLTDESETEQSDSCEQEAALEVLSKKIKENVIKIRKFEVAITKQIDSNLTLALARNTDGSNEMCAILPMRKAHKNRTMLDHTVKARKQLQELRSQIEQALLNESFFTVCIKGHKNQLKEVLNSLKQPPASSMPSDEELLQELNQREFLEAGPH